MINNFLDKRLLTICNLVDKCDLLADIGTDHALVPIYLIRNNLVKKVIASDVAINPLNRAKENISYYHLENKIDTILSNGLEKIPQEVNTVIIAGMGGHLISSIIEKSNFDYDTYILQGNSHCEVIRKTLMNKNYKIIDEEIAYSDHKYYEIIKACKGKEILNDLQLKYGPINIKKMQKEFVEMLENRLLVLKNIVSELEINSQAYIEKNKEIAEINIILGGK